MNKLLIVCFLIVLINFADHVNAEDTEILTISPKIVSVGEQFVVYVKVDNIINLSAADYVINYNTSVCEIVNVLSVETNGSKFNINYSLDNGKCKIVQYIEDDALTGTFYLSKLIFNCTNNGHTPIMIDGNLSSINGTKIDVAWKNSHINATNTRVFFNSPDITDGLFFANLSIINVENLSSYNVEINYDETMVELIEVGNGILNEAEVIVNYSHIAGRVKIVGIVNESGNGTLSKLIFSPINVGETTINITNLTISDKNAEKIKPYIQNKTIILQTNPPTANFEYVPLNPTTASIINFDSSMSYDENGFILNYSWEMGDGNIRYGKLVNYSYTDDSRYLVNLTVIDNDGNRDTSTKEILVLNTAPNVLFNINPQNPNTNTNITFTDLSTDEDGTIINWTWDFGDGTKTYLKNPHHQYDLPGQYTINLTVFDDDNAKNSILRKLNITRYNQPPLPPILLNPINNQDDLSIPVTLSIQVLDPDNDRVNVSFFDATTNTVIKSVNNITSGNTVSINWNYLQYNTEYSWYVKISDRQYTTSSEIWRFKTKQDISITYSLSVIVLPTSSGVVTPSSGEYTKGQTITLSAIANNGYEFDSWSGDASSYGDNPIISIKMDSNFNIIAKFKLSNIEPPPNEYVLTTFVEPENGGYLNLNPTGSIYQEGTIVSITAVPFEGYIFNHWNGDLSGNNSTRTLLINSDKTVEAFFTVINSPNIIPIVEIIEPDNNSKVSGKIIIKGNASDIDGTLKRVEIRINDNEWETASGTSLWSFQINTENFKNEIYRIHARSYDGNDYSTTVSINIEIFNEISSDNNPIDLQIILGIIALIGIILISAIYMIRRR